MASAWDCERECAILKDGSNLRHWEVCWMSKHNSYMEPSPQWHTEDSGLASGKKDSVACILFKVSEMIYKFDK